LFCLCCVYEKFFFFVVGGIWGGGCFKKLFLKKGGGGGGGGLLPIPKLTTQYKLMKLFLFMQNNAISHMNNLLKLDIASLS